VHASAAMLDHLAADGPEAADRDDLELFGRLIGSWELDMRSIDRDGATHRFSGEWHFGWVLEGRAVQDVLITRSPDGEIVGYGSTVRSFDRRTGQWWIVWQDPLAGEFSVLFGQPEGDRIVLRGQWSLGGAAQSFRWIFSAISEEAFHWECRILDDCGEWRLAEEMWANRVSGRRAVKSGR
jgi:hypothetical protein